MYYILVGLGSAFVLFLACVVLLLPTYLLSFVMSENIAIPLGLFIGVAIIMAIAAWWYENYT